MTYKRCLYGAFGLDQPKDLANQKSKSKTKATWTPHLGVLYIPIVVCIISYDKGYEYIHQSEVVPALLRSDLQGNARRLGWWD